MLKLINISKRYETGGTAVDALRGVDIEFRRSEFVAVLGPSGCGKTTLLNLIGGLDRYSGGELIIDGVSTKEYKDADWDIYRNKAVGFVFQTYNLIPHQTALANVELALTLSGVSPGERKRRAIAALERVGLADQLRKKPNEMSGGQMQRVAIARALVNDPEILLADEPTGALDTENSVQIMEILKDIAADRLVIMVTHNSALADRYASRVVKLLDGRVISDTNPYIGHMVKQPDSNAADAAGAARTVSDHGKLKERRNRKKPLSLLTSLSLSLNNLLTKKARTILTGFAGSIGIIGIALILSMSNGMQTYISSIEQDTVSSYPITIQSRSMEMGTMMTTAASIHQNVGNHGKDKIYINNIMGTMISSMSRGVSANDLPAFKEYLDANADAGQYLNDIQYRYNTPLNIYKADASSSSSGVAERVHPSRILEYMQPSGMESMGSLGSMGSMNSMMIDNMDAWRQLVSEGAALNEQYDILAGRLPREWNEIVIIADANNEINDYMLFSLGLRNPDEIRKMMMSARSGGALPEEQSSYTYDELMGLTFKLVPETAYFEKSGGTWQDRSADDAYIKEIVDAAPSLVVVGILRETMDSGMMSNMNGVVGYTGALVDYVIESVNTSEIVTAQLGNPDVDVFSGRPFPKAGGSTRSLASLANLAAFAKLTPEQQARFTKLTPEQQAQLAQLPAEQQAAMMSGELDPMDFITPAGATYDDNLKKLGITDKARPSSIRLYPKDFASKGKVTDMIVGYNKEMSAAGMDDKVIQYTDITAMLMKSVDNVISGISTVLIAFVAVSLVVSSIMIGIITYVSVLERTKEIGILRSIGASKGDISRVFNAETLILGFLAGALGIGATLLLCIPANAIIKNLSGISNAARLPLRGGVSLVLISMALTFIAGLIPSRIAARKDPVVALRTE